MKKTTFTFALLVQALFASAQIYVAGALLGPNNAGQYIELDPMYRDDGRCTFRVDYGQARPKEDYVTDAQGKRLEFRSLVDGLNVFYYEGWELVQISVQERGRRFMLKRRF